ncbi:sulfurtransferase [Pelagibius litoralis]|uniref:Sulfurtransferase n=1 Tax=Pelagibius litoralis TaxID=374515 RepID=A0A967F096_9PROT|nr:sulfurtransferase [Pelagibius litoralis]NIA70758.1 sulfurtransferase [Pelagibius litoralis]
MLQSTSQEATGFPAGRVAALAVLLLVGFVLQPQAGAGAAGAEAVEAPGPLVDVAWVKANAANDAVRLLDIRNKIGGGSAAVFAQGHIPGSVYSDYLQDGWRTKREGVPGQLPSVASLEALIGGLGIGNDHHVVIVAAGASALEMGSATRVYWTFKVLGHDAVSILDGGYRAYTADQANPVATGRSLPEAVIFAAQFRPEMVADRDDVAAAMQSGGTLIDNRPTAQYLGQSSHPAAQRPGTIPGAVSVPESQLTDAKGRFVSSTRVAALLEAAGVGAGDEEAITFCNTGHWASLGWFAQSEILGRKNVRLYDGSMVDWTAQTDLPIEVEVAKTQ